MLSSLALWQVSRDSDVVPFVVCRVVSACTVIKPTTVQEGNTRTRQGMKVRAQLTVRLGIFILKLKTPQTPNFTPSTRSAGNLSVAKNSGKQSSSNRKQLATAKLLLVGLLHSLAFAASEGGESASGN